MSELDAVLSGLTQIEPVSGGIHTPPAARLLLIALALLVEAKDILETGYDAGMTTEALAQTGARVVAVDNGSEYPEAKAAASDRLTGYANVRLVYEEAIVFMQNQPDESFDLIFIDDWHFPVHVKNECIEVKRLLRPGGIAVFHDTTVCGLWPIIEMVLQDWEGVNLPCRTKTTQAFIIPGTDDFGLGVVRKPG